MIHHDIRFDVLHLLFSFAQADHPADARILARLLLMSQQQVHQVLQQLEGMGLVDAVRVRLTMDGLVVAASVRQASLGAQTTLLDEAA